MKTKKKIEIKTSISEKFLTISPLFPLGNSIHTILAPPSPPSCFPLPYTSHSSTFIKILPSLSCNIQNS